MWSMVRKGAGGKKVYINCQGHNVPQALAIASELAIAILH